MKNVFTIDVEDWFHIMGAPSTPDPKQWDSLPSRVQTHFFQLLDLLDERRIKATCFFLGWATVKHAHLIQEAVRRGHEIASHGCWHQLIFEMSAKDFLNDIRNAKNRLEDICGQRIQTYRAPGFSVTEDTPFFFETLLEAGYKVDSSIFPCSREHGGLLYDCYHPHTLHVGESRLIEFPISTTNLLGRRTCFSGGGYFRLFPYKWIAAKIREYNRNGFPAICYIHPRDIDADQPRLSLNARRRFMSYYGLQYTKRKLKKLVNDFEFTSIADFIKDGSHQFLFEHERDQPFIDQKTIR